MQALESIKVLFRHKGSLGPRFGHKWLTHFGCASGFSWLYHAFFGWGFISRHGAYQWFFFPWRSQGCFGHSVFMCSSLTFLSHTDNTLFFLLVFFGRFWQESYVGMWRLMGLGSWKSFKKPFNKASNLTTDILWWYKPSFYGGLCPICFYKELSSGDSIFVL